MFAVMSPISAYQRTGVETGVESANPHKLILMLFEGAQQALANAKLHIRHNEIAQKGLMISKAIMIIDHGLKASLDMNAGGDIAPKLFSLYEYMTHRLLTANLKNDIEIINEVNGLLSQLHEAWESIDDNNITKLMPQTTAN
ncbi:MAG: flagellar export chaperone FliS [Nitrosomonas sp.]|nr:flagellar export chaperone FliS [Nitrosomonas sp.]MDP1950566.1 flagellar export chaperone FliS [Nitrosomonas sp.]